MNVEKHVGPKEVPCGSLNSVMYSFYETPLQGAGNVRRRSKRTKAYGYKMEVPRMRTEAYAVCRAVGCAYVQQSGVSPKEGSSDGADKVAAV